MSEHEPPARHPEAPERLLAILRHLDRTGYSKAMPLGTVREATDEELERVHPIEYIREVSAIVARGGGTLDPDTWISPASDRAARLAVGAAIEAVSHVMSGPDRRAFCAVRPPGHHARPAHGMGFCVYATVAIAVKDALARLDLNRVLVVDFDVHHGNGTQEILYDSARSGFMSIHRYPFYPGTGARDETGTGAGLGHILNVPLPYGISREKYRDAFRSGLETLASKIKPELVLISAGFDAHAEDPVGDLGLDVEDFDTITRAIVDVAQTHASGRIVSVLEGGYNVPILAGSVIAHLDALGVKPG
jgi:acetoin utilization deacetylase AcuC-like enzyme